MFFYISNHSEEFSATMVLSFAVGSFFIGGLMHFVENTMKVFVNSAQVTTISATGTRVVATGALTAAISRYTLAVLMFFHCIDDPMYLLPGLINPVMEGIRLGELEASKHSFNTTVLDAPKFDSLGITVNVTGLASNRTAMQHAIFGIQKTFSQMSDIERVNAFGNFSSFICHNSNGTVFLPLDDLGGRFKNNDTTVPLEMAC